ncbi:MAG: EF-hand domain-containing protein [Planctomycetaceae bacterium]|nr:EF-hand domain-containing protein [Planctomycetaceae bacterium]
MKRYLIPALACVVIAITVYAVMPRARAWPRGAWDAADHNRDGVLTRDEMQTFGGQAPHRNAPRLMWHFDRADINHDQLVDATEVDAYGTAVGSKDPHDHLPPPVE